LIRAAEVQVACIREHPEHVEEALARRRAGVDRLFGRLQRGPLGSHGANDILKVPDTPREAINAGDHQHIALSQEIEHGSPPRSLVQRLYARGRRRWSR
jgi:hypothetical protein